MNYEVGLVNLNPHIKDIQTLENACRSLGYRPLILDLTQLTKEKVYLFIKRSKIKKWIFSGSRLMVTDLCAPKIPLEIFNLENKEFMMICYSLQSVIYQMDYPISYRKNNKKEVFDLYIDRKTIEHMNKQYLFENIAMPMKLWRNHYAFFSPSHIINTNPNNDLIDLVSYDGECMMLFYKNSILLQYHPEKTNDGLQLMYNWFRK